MTEYTTRGLVGLLVPPANPTVEAEMHRLLAPDLGIVTTRLPVGTGDLSQRLQQYNSALLSSARSFGGLPLDVLYYACTGASYVAGRPAEERLLEALTVGGAAAGLTAARAIIDTLRGLGAHRVAVLSPYPAWLTESAVRYYEDAGLDIVQVSRLETGPAGIYALTSEEVLPAARALLASSPDALLLSGTGMPSLRPCTELTPLLGVPVLSSAVCASWRLSEVLAARHGVEPSSFRGRELTALIAALTTAEPRPSSTKARAP